MQFRKNRKYPWIGPAHDTRIWFCLCAHHKTTEFQTNGSGLHTELFAALSGTSIKEGLQSMVDFFNSIHRSEAATVACDQRQFLSLTLNAFRLENLYALKSRKHADIYVQDQLRNS